MFRLTGDCGNWRSLRGIFFFWPHTVSAVWASVVINIHLSSCGFSWRYELLMIDWGLDITLNPPRQENSVWYFASVQSIYLSIYLSELKCRAEHLFEARCCASRRHSIIPINNLNYNRFSKQIPDISSSSSIKSHFSVICNRKRPVGDDYIAEFLQRCSDESRRFQCSKCLFTGAWRAHLAS